MTPFVCKNVASGLRTREVHLSPSPAEPVVLIVEDEPLIRMSAIDFIEDAGFLTLDAATADDALIQLKARRDIAAVFTDIDMLGSLDALSLNI
ncbi:hypothetical protein [Agrobacterium rosae]|uniref:hypothetical protein n=1 Tax=Agrobacterium rosae TaxID=1972867 RepID=UPI0020336272|nr:hypothetical protein [Agrobacterium rosae]